MPSLMINSKSAPHFGSANTLPAVPELCNSKVLRTKVREHSGRQKLWTVLGSRCPELILEANLDPGVGPEKDFKGFGGNLDPGVGPEEDLKRFLGIL